MTALEIAREVQALFWDHAVPGLNCCELIIQAWGFELEPKPNPAPLADVTQKNLAAEELEKTVDDKKR